MITFKDNPIRLGLGLRKYKTKDNLARPIWVKGRSAIKSHECLLAGGIVFLNNEIEELKLELQAIKNEER